MLVNISDLVIEDRQRKDLGAVDELAESIKLRGLINPITIAPLEDGYKLIAGERRVRAHEALGRSKVEARLFEDLSPRDQQLIELEENIKRKQLSWQEEAEAVAQLATVMNGNIPAAAEQAGLSENHVRKLIRVNKEIQKGNENVKSANTIDSADRIASRKNARETDALIADLDLGGDERPKTTDGTPEQAAPESPIICADFVSWIDEYSGPSFNLIHCDFPYGIDYDKARQGQVESWGAYDDSIENYQRLCSTLTTKHNQFMAPSFHVIFWFSMVHYQWTLDHFTNAGFVVDPRPLVWHKTDNKGMAGDASRRYRNVYETAFLMSFGDRKLASCPANAYGAPSSKSSHLNEKSEAMLKHFLKGVCDELSEVIDPTCGSGSAIRAASALGAKRVLGLELNPDYAEEAARKYKAAESLARASELT